MTNVYVSSLDPLRHWNSACKHRCNNTTAIAGIALIGQHAYSTYQREVVK